VSPSGNEGIREGWSDAFTIIILMKQIGPSDVSKDCKNLSLKAIDPGVKNRDREYHCFSSTNYTKSHGV